METIKNYLDNMFAVLPKTAQLEDLKNNILANMEDKYNELKAQGKSENEAIGIVISEFGNIDELIQELGIKVEEADPSAPVITQNEVNAYLRAKKTNGLQVAIGVMLCILAPAALILLNQLGDDYYINKIISGDLIGIIVMLVLVTIAVGIFITSGNVFEKYKYVEKGVQLSAGLRAELQSKYDDFSPKYNLSLIAGVSLLILSPIALFVTSNHSDAVTDYGVVALFIIASIGIFFLIYFGSIRESYTRLLKLGDYAPKPQKKEDKIIGAVAAIMWPLAAVIFLITGFIYNQWYINWIVFPITGILFGMFSAAYSILTGKSNE